MNTTKNAAQCHPCSPKKKWLAGVLVAAAIGCGTAQSHRGTVIRSDGRGTTLIMLDRNRSDTSIIEMRNYIFALNMILGKLVGRAVELSRLYSEPPFERAISAIQVSRTAKEVAEDFVGRCNAALTSEEVRPEEMESLRNRYSLAHGLLVDSILQFRDGLNHSASDIHSIPASLGYPEIDIFSDF